MGICLFVKWFIQMPGTIIVLLVIQNTNWLMHQYSDHHLSTGILVLGIWIANHLNYEQVKVRYSDFSAIQMLAIQTPLYLWSFDKM